MTEPQPTIFIVDDDRSVLKAVSRLLRAAGFNVVSSDSPQRFLENCDRTAHGCVVLDLAMPDLNGLQLQEALAAKGAYLPIIFLSGRSNIPSSVRAMKHGAVDFLTKPVDEGELLNAVRAAVSLDAAARHARAEVAEIRRRLGTLTPREYEVFEHVVSGKLNKETAYELGTVEKTIKVHRGRLMEKMQVRSVAELVHLAERAQVSGSTPLP
jgi:FixJ family two-component response regulator